MGTTSREQVSYVGNSGYQQQPKQQTQTGWHGYPESHPPWRGYSPPVVSKTTDSSSYGFQTSGPLVGGPYSQPAASSFVSTSRAASPRTASSSVSCMSPPMGPYYYPYSNASHQLNRQRGQRIPSSPTSSAPSNASLASFYSSHIQPQQHQRSLSGVGSPLPISSDMEAVPSDGMLVPPFSMDQFPPTKDEPNSIPSSDFEGTFMPMKMVSDSSSQQQQQQQ